MSDADPVTEAWDSIITRYVVGMGLVVLLYDLIITMNKEVGSLSLISSTSYLNNCRCY
jgi:multisubunit Na+/H+ antiporter MnhC subunit